MEQSARYAGRGVSSGKEEVHQAIAHLDKGLFPKAFCKIVPDDLTGSEEHCLVMHADGAGTKSALAYMVWKETGDLSVWKGIAQDALVMNLDDLLCVGALGPILVSSTIGRNKALIPGEVIGALISGTEELLAELRTLGMDIRSTGGETADLGDLVRTGKPGERGRLVAFACVGPHPGALLPCGRCRQLLFEHGGPDLLIDRDGGPVPLSFLLPDAFSGDDLP
jgi:phosphoribosylformylglycinamidine cyclo-ligase